MLQIIGLITLFLSMVDLYRTFVLLSREICISIRIAIWYISGVLLAQVAGTGMMNRHPAGSFYLNPRIPFATEGKRP